jgi:hypothetical protein
MAAIMEATIKAPPHRSNGRGHGHQEEPLMTPSSVTASPLVVREYRAGRALCMCGCGRLATVPKKTNRTHGEVKGRPRPYLRGHCPRKSRPAIDRFLEKVDRSSPDGCWLWTGFIWRSGYGCFWQEDGASTRAHRFAYEHFVGPIPDGLVLDHLCRVRHCVNPDHLEPVTERENILRGESSAAESARRTHCVHGHPFSGDNLRIATSGQRVCRTCERQRQWDNRKPCKAGCGRLIWNKDPGRTGLCASCVQKERYA